MASLSPNELICICLLHTRGENTPLLILRNWCYENTLKSKIAFGIYMINGFWKWYWNKSATDIFNFSSDSLSDCFFKISLKYIYNWYFQYLLSDLRILYTKSLNSLRPSNTIWYQETWSTLVQVRSHHLQTNADLLFMGPSGTNSSEFWITNTIKSQILDTV